MIICLCTGKTDKDAKKVLEESSSEVSKPYLVKRVWKSFDPDKKIKDRCGSCKKGICRYIEDQKQPQD